MVIIKVNEKGEYDIGKHHYRLQAIVRFDRRMMIASNEDDIICGLHEFEQMTETTLNDIIIKTINSSCYCNGILPANVSIELDEGLIMYMTSMLERLAMA